MDTVLQWYSSVCVCVCVYAYMCVHMYVFRDRDHDTELCIGHSTYNTVLTWHFSTIPLLALTHSRVCMCG